MYKNTQVLKELTSSIPNHQSLWEKMISELISKGSSFEPQKLRDSKPNGGVKKILESWGNYKGKSDGFINEHLSFDKEIEVKNDLKTESNILDFSQLLWANLNVEWSSNSTPAVNRQSGFRRG